MWLSTTILPRTRTKSTVFSALSFPLSASVPWPSLREFPVSPRSVFSRLPNSSYVSVLPSSLSFQNTPFIHNLPSSCLYNPSFLLPSPHTSTPLAQLLFYSPSFFYMFEKNLTLFSNIICVLPLPPHHLFRYQNKHTSLIATTPTATSRHQYANHFRMHSPWRLNRIHYSC
ncbi:hypothetical protein F5H01DRAFT_85005 [Linnemannia elongata]|nr:hypothetical protein F5H01DRAFT_85005 [Linnemannia elongata]